MGSGRGVPGGLGIQFWAGGTGDSDPGRGKVRARHHPPTLGSMAHKAHCWDSVSTCHPGSPIPPSLVGATPTSLHPSFLPQSGSHMSPRTFCCLQVKVRPPGSLCPRPPLATIPHSLPRTSGPCSAVPPTAGLSSPRGPPALPGLTPPDLSPSIPQSPGRAVGNRQAGRGDAGPG